MREPTEPVSGAAPRTIPIHIEPRDLPWPRPAMVDASGALVDRLARPLVDLRISVTDRCNFRCTYCMPKESFAPGHRFLTPSELLSFDQIVSVARLFRRLGVRKVRVTGGEPLLRRNLPRLIERLAAIGGLEVTLTTNGSLLGRHAAELKQAGLRRLNVSLDALDEPTFQRMNDVGFEAASVLRGIEAAEAAGFGTIKINMVVQRGVNDHAVTAMAARFRGTGHIVRFIEYMDVGSTNRWSMTNVVPSAEVLSRIAAVFPLEPLAPGYGGEVAERWRYRDGAGEIGFISSITRSFCRDCTRLRLSADGRMYTCLFASKGFDLRPLLDAETTEEERLRRLAAVWQSRTDRYSELRSAAGDGRPRIEMSYIGG